MLLCVLGTDGQNIRYGLLVSQHIVQYTNTIAAPTLSSEEKLQVRPRVIQRYTGDCRKLVKYNHWEMVW